MNKKKIIKKAAINADLTVKEEQKAVEAFLCAVSDILKEDREVFLVRHPQGRPRGVPA